MAQQRTIHGRFLVRPDPFVTQAYLYALGYFAKRYGIVLHEFVLMSNHDHLLFTDPRGVRPEFIQQVHAFVARAINAKYRENDSVWSGQQHSAPVLPTVGDVLKHCIYVLLNPVKAGLVRYAWDWTGATSWHLEYGKPLMVKRPDVFFSKKMPDEVEVVIQRPEGGYPGLSDAAARHRLREDARREQGDIIVKIQGAGRRFMGMRRVMQQPRHDNPNKRPSIGGIRPTFSSRSKWHRIEAARNLRQFRAEHDEARLAVEAGDWNVLFPPGTYLMRRRFNVKIRPP